MSDGRHGGKYLRATPAGCYYAVEGVGKTRERALLLELLGRPDAPSADDPAVAGIAPRLIEAGFVERIESADALPGGALDEHLKTVLPALSDAGAAVLIESRQGLFLDYAGVSREEAEELAALAADLGRLSERRATPLSERLGVSSRALAIVDPGGCSEVGFWPLHVADNVFTLTILGVPLLNNPSFRTLVWMLVERYGKTPDVAGTC